MGITIQLPRFEGPLDLLLYLIRKEEMDIFDIKINAITGQYLDYIKVMRELDLEVAGDFISMASTLIHIKSRMLLPQYNDEGEVIEGEDPRKELVQRLLEYQKYQEAAKSLYDRSLVGRDVLLRGVRENLKPKEEEVLLEENALYALISMYRKAVRSFEKKIHKVSKRAQSIASRILDLKALLVVGVQTRMSQLIDSVEDQRKQVLITFLSLLELGKLGFVGLSQNETYGEIYIDPKREIEADVISRVEEFDGMHAAQAAEDLLSRTVEVEQVDETASDAEILAAESES